MALVSIVIPAVGSQNDLDDTLVSVLENRPDHCEVILAHPPQYVDPYDLGDEVHLVCGTSSNALSLFNSGVRASRGELVHLLAPGMIATQGWCDPIADLMEDRNVGSVAPSVVSGRRVVHGVAFDSMFGRRLVTRRQCAPLAPLVEAGFYRAAAMRITNGFSEDWGRLADIELGLRMRAASYKHMRCRDSQLQWKSSLDLLTPGGFRGGAMRAELHKLAMSQGMGGSKFGLFGEFAIHRFGPTSFAGLAGRLFGKSPSSPSAIEPRSDETLRFVRKPSPPAEDQNRQLRRAA